MVSDEAIMSLKTFHIIFVTISTLFAFLFGGWMMKSYEASKQTADLVLGLCSFAGGVALLVYGRYFLKKLKRIGYL